MARVRIIRTIMMVSATAGATVTVTHNVVKARAAANATAAPAAKESKAAVVARMVSVTAEKNESARRSKARSSERVATTNGASTSTATDTLPSRIDSACSESTASNELRVCVAAVLVVMTDELLLVVKRCGFIVGAGGGRFAVEEFCCDAHV